MRLAPSGTLSLCQPLHLPVALTSVHSTSFSYSFPTSPPSSLQYLSNASLSMTSVASTTILSSTSALFTLLFGVTMGEDTLSVAKVVAVLVSIAGVVMTELGKSTAADDNEVFGDSARNPGETAGDAV